MITNKPPKQYTIAKFAEKHGLARSTVWRWVTDKDQVKRLKMYDAKKIKVAGKVFIEV